MLLALLMLVATGCSKEEVMAPGAAPQVSKSLKPAQGSGDQGGTTVTSGNGASPITDDGDDLGDKERSNKPKP